MWLASKLKQNSSGLHLDERVVVEKRTVVERLVHWTTYQEVAGLNPDGSLNFRFSDSALSKAP